MNNAKSKPWTTALPPSYRAAEACSVAWSAPERGGATHVSWWVHGCCDVQHAAGNLRPRLPLPQSWTSLPRHTQRQTIVSLPRISHPLKCSLPPPRTCRDEKTHLIRVAAGVARPVDFRSSPMSSLVLPSHHFLSSSLPRRCFVRQTRRSKLSGTVLLEPCR